MHIKKILCLILFWLFSLYPPVELTRVILVWVNDYGFAKDFLVELPFIWVGYTLMMLLFYIILFTKWEDTFI